MADVVAPHAAEVDRSPMFPRAAIIGLADAGLLALPGGAAGESGPSLAAGVRIVAELARHCAATATVLLTHYATSALLQAHGGPDVRRDLSAGELLATLATFGTRTGWSPAGTALEYVGGFRLDARAEAVVSAGQADVYVWATSPVRAKGRATLWLLSEGTPGLRVAGAYEAVGLRGAAIAPVTSQSVTVPVESMVGPNGDGLDLLAGTALPWLLAGAGALVAGIVEAILAGVHDAVGIVDGAQAAAAEGTAGSDESTLAAVGRISAWANSVRAVTEAAGAAWDEGHPDALRLAAEARLAAEEAARAVTEATPGACGEAATLAGAPIERHLRDLGAAAALAPGADAAAVLAGRVASRFAPFQ